LYSNTASVFIEVYSRGGKNFREKKSTNEKTQW